MYFENYILKKKYVECSIRRIKKSLITLMIIWFAMVGTLLTYLLVCYAVLIEENYKILYAIDILQTKY